MSKYERINVCMYYIICIVLYNYVYMYYIICIVLYNYVYMYYIICIVLYNYVYMYYIICIVLYNYVYMYYIICIVLYNYVLHLLGVLLSIYYVFTLFEYIKHIILSLIANKLIKDLNQNMTFLKFIYCPLKSGYRCDRNSLSIVIPNIPLYKYALESICRLISFLDH